MTTRAAIYGRQSHGKKKSISDQLKLGVDVVDENSWELAGSYSDKVGASRYSTKIRGGWEEVRQAVRLRNEDARIEAGRHARPGRQVHLLSYYAECDACDETVRAYKEVYACPAGHIWIRRARVNSLIEELVIARLSSPDLYASLRHAGDAVDETIREAEGEAAALLQTLEEWRQSARRGETTPVSLAVIEAGLTKDIVVLERKIKEARIPQALQGFTGPKEDVRTRWAYAPVQAKRGVLRALGLRVRLLPAGGRTLPIEDRVAVDWL